MLHSFCHVVLVDPAAGSRAAIRNMMQGMEWIFLAAELADYGATLELVAQSKPDGIIVNLDADPAKGLPLIDRVVERYPRCALLVYSSHPELLVEAHRHGAKSLLVHPVQLEDLSQALRNLAAGLSLHRPTKGKIIAVLSSRGGVGCTSLAINLGCTFAADQEQQPVLIDLDPLLGAADTALDLSPSSRFADLCLNTQRLDLKLLRDSLTVHSSGLRLLPRPTRCRELRQVSDEQFKRLLTLLRIIHSHLIIDVGKGLSPLDLQALEMADTILLVSQLELASIRNAVCIRMSLADEGLDDKVHIVMNRVEAGFGKEAISLAKAEEVIGKRVSWQLPNDPKTLMAAWSAGQGVIQCAPKSKVQQNIAALAAELFPRPEPTPARNAPTVSGGGNPTWEARAESAPRPANPGSRPARIL